MHIDRDAIQWSAAPEDRTGRPLLVLMHGRGGHEGDLVDLRGALPSGLVVASLRAPLAAPARWSWFDDSVDAATPDAAALAVLDWLDDLEPPPWLGLLGFSQGGGMAMQLLRHAPTRFDCAVQLAGFVPFLHDPRDVQLRAARPPVFSGHGELDDVIPPDAARQTAVWLSEHTDLEEHRYPGLDHSVSMEQARDVSAFLRRQLDPA